MELKYISVQPATDYFAWQVEVYLVNFLSLGIDPKSIQVLGSYDIKPSDSWTKLQEAYPEVEFYFYKDSRNDKRYIPSIQSHVMAKHFRKFSYLEENAFFFHDCDFTFTKRFDFSPYLNDNKWYFSDTISYIGADYIKSKSVNLFNKMCELVGVPPKLIEDNQMNSGGAQKLMKNLTADYWIDVESGCNAIFSGLGNIAKEKSEKDPNPLQIWCASMWSELWNAFKHKHEVRVPKEFDFCWATCNSDRWDQVSFFHNAGVTDSKSNLLFKADYINSTPYNTNLSIDPSKCSFFYYQQIKRAGRNSPLK